MIARGAVGLLLALAVVLVSCGSRPPTDSGVKGLVLAGPSCPAGSGSPCPSEKPVRMDVAATNAGGRVVATVASGEDGRFKIDLPPGEYVLRAARWPAPPILRNDVLVRVTAATYVEVTLHADTGAP